MGRKGFDSAVFLSKAGAGKMNVDCQKDQVLFAQEDPADAVFYIQSGKLKMTVVSEHGKEVPQAQVHRIQRIACAIALAGLCVGPTWSVSGQTAQTPPDNSKVNTRDRAKGEVTADQQKETAADRELTRKIRSALVQDKTLSSYAHNVKVITQGGQVTLKGPVRSEDDDPRMKSVWSRAKPLRWRVQATFRMR
jgi:lipopolysaccharide export system protein LptC